MENHIVYSYIYFFVVLLRNAVLFLSIFPEPIEKSVPPCPGFVGGGCGVPKVGKVPKLYFVVGVKLKLNPPVLLPNWKGVEPLVLEFPAVKVDTGLPNVPPEALKVLVAPNIGCACPGNMKALCDVLPEPKVLWFETNLGICGWVGIDTTVVVFGFPKVVWFWPKMGVWEFIPKGLTFDPNVLPGEKTLIDLSDESVALCDKVKVLFIDWFDVAAKFWIPALEGTSDAGEPNEIPKIFALIAVEVGAGDWLMLLERKDVSLFVTPKVKGFTVLPEVKDGWVTVVNRGIDVVIKLLVGVTKLVVIQKDGETDDDDDDVTNEEIPLDDVDDVPSGKWKPDAGTVVTVEDVLDVVTWFPLENWKFIGCKLKFIPPGVLVFVVTGTLAVVRDKEVFNPEKILDVEVTADTKSVFLLNVLPDEKANGLLIS